ncbi:hypothetical protein [Methylobacterium sp. E-045]|uniref:hypothetical protein n=1 Tax=Methylobacterium sp. E-045 TaxID=2836575 RepID=UPI001FBAE626|nr:hypothetical protein [Methylobacterium sp. E-045]MCJ2131276.1 hypothetical protein [Methylobacterium sp. E-045]
MKLRLTQRAAVSLGYSDMARFLGRARRWRCSLLKRAGHEVGRGNVITAAVLVAVYVVAL